MAEGKSSRAVWYLIKLTQLCLVIILIEPFMHLARISPALLSAPDLFIYEFRYSGVSTLILLAMLMILQYSKTVVATMCCLFAAAGVTDPIFYDWADYMLEDLKWAIPFGVAGVALVAAIYLERSGKDEV